MLSCQFINNQFGGAAKQNKPNQNKKYIETVKKDQKPIEKEKILFCCYCNRDIQSKENGFDTESDYLLPVFDKHNFSHYISREDTRENGINSCPAIILNDKVLDYIQNFTKPTTKICQITKSNFNDVINNNITCDLMHHGFGYLLCNGTVSARLLFEHILLDPRLIIRNDNFELYAKRILCPRFWFNLHTNEKLIDLEKFKKEFILGEFDEILQLIYKKAFEVAINNDIKKIINETKSNRDKLKITLKNELKLLEKKNKELLDSQLHDKYDETYINAKKKIYNDNSLIISTFETKLNSRIKNSERKLLSRLNISGDEFYYVSKNLGVKSDLEQLEKKINYQEIVTKVLSGDFSKSDIIKYITIMKKEGYTEIEALNAIPSKKTKKTKKQNSKKTKKQNTTLIKEVSSKEEFVKKYNILNVNDLEKDAIFEAAKKIFRREFYTKQFKTDINDIIENNKNKVIDSESDSESDSDEEYNVKFEIVQSKKELITKNYKLKNYGFDLDDWQVKLLQNIKDEKSCIVSVPTGGGKTFTMMKAIDMILNDKDNKNVLLYVAPSNQLSLQIYANIKETFPNIKISLITENYNIDDESNKPIIYVGTPIALMNYTKANNKFYSIGIFDEIHLLSPSYASNEFEYARARGIYYMLTRCVNQIICASATIKNLPELNNYIQKHITKQIYELLKSKEINDEFKIRGLNKDATSIYNNYIEKMTEMNTLNDSFIEVLSVFEPDMLKDVRLLLINKCTETEKFQIINKLSTFLKISNQEFESKYLTRSNEITASKLEYLISDVSTLENDINQYSIILSDPIEYNERVITLIEHTFDGENIYSLQESKENKEKITNESLLKLLCLIKNERGKIPCLIFEETEEMAFNNFSTIVNKLSKKNKIMYMIRDKLANEIEKYIEEFNVIVENKKDEYAELSSSKEKTKNDTKKTTDIDRLNSKLEQLKEKIKTIIKTNIRDCLLKIANNPDYLLSITPEQNNLIKKIFEVPEDNKLILSDSTVININELKNISYELKEILNYYFKVDNLSGIDENINFSFPKIDISVSKELSFNKHKNLLITLNNILNKKSDRSNFDRIRSEKMCLAEGLNINDSYITELLELYIEGAKFGISCVIPSLPLFLQIAILTSIKNSTTSDPHIGFIFVSQSMTIGIDYPIMSVIIKAPNGKINSSNYSSTQLIQMAGRCGRRGKTESNGFVYYYGTTISSQNNKVDNIDLIELENSSFIKNINIDGKIITINYYVVELFKLSLIPKDLTLQIETVDINNQKKMVDKTINPNDIIIDGLCVLYKAYRYVSDDDAILNVRILLNIYNNNIHDEYLEKITELHNTTIYMIYCAFEINNLFYKIDFNTSDFNRFTNFIINLLNILRKIEIIIIKNYSKSSVLLNNLSDIEPIIYLTESIKSNLSSTETILPSEYNIINVAGDGDCLFNSLLQQQTTNENTFNLRSKITTYIRSRYQSDEEYKTVLLYFISDWSEQNKQHPELIDYDSLTETGKIEKYLSLMIKPINERIGFNSIYWGGGLEIMAFTEVMKNENKLTRVNLLYSDNNNITKIEPSLAGMQPAAPSLAGMQPDIVLNDIYIYYLGNHYNYAIRS